MDLKRLARIMERVEGILATIAMVILTLIIFSVCLEIIMRYFLNRPLVWVVELTEYALLYVTFLGAAWLLKEGGHVRVDVVLNFMSRRWQTRWALFSSALGLLVSLILTVFGAIVTIDHLLRGMFKPTILEFPTGVVLAAIPVGCFFLTVRYLRMLIDNFTELVLKPERGGKEI